MYMRFIQFTFIISFCSTMLWFVFLGYENSLITSDWKTKGKPECESYFDSDVYLKIQN
jgi:hypothetical protein